MYTVLTLNFFFPSIVYALDPVSASRQFERIGAVLGVGAYILTAGEGGDVWRILAVGNVLSLGFMCALLQFDPRRGIQIVEIQTPTSPLSKQSQ